jgi:cytoskeletal protein RodZ
MKRCQHCNRIYTDDTFQFCLEDGADLIIVNDERETEGFRVSGGSAVNNNSSKSKWLALLLAGSALLLIGFGLTTAILYFVFRAEGRNNAADNSNSSSPISNSSSTDDETELKNIMQKLSVAFIENDTKTLDYYLANEYKDENSNGESYTKTDAMKPETLEERESLRHFDMKVSVEGEKATIEGKGELKYSLFSVPVTQKFDFKTQFVNRDGRWQAVYSYSQYTE